MGIVLIKVSIFFEIFTLKLKIVFTKLKARFECDVRGITRKSRNHVAPDTITTHQQLLQSVTTTQER